MTLALILLGSLLVWPQVSKKMDLISSSMKNTLKPKGLQASIDMTKVQFFSEDEKGQPFTISSDQITEVDVQNKIVQLINPKGEMTFSSGVKIFSSSPEAFFYQNTQIVDFKKVVDVLSDNGYQAKTSDVVVDHKNQLAYSNSPLVVRGEKIDLDSIGFYVRKNGEEFDFYGPVRIELKTPKKNIVIIAEKIVEVRQKAQTITAFSNVIADDGVNKIYSEKLTAYFNQTGKNQYVLRSVRAKENVRIQTPDEEITGKEAFYDVIKERAVVTENVVAKRSEGNVQADKAVIDMKKGTSLLETNNTETKQRVKGTIFPTQLKKRE